MSDILPLFTVQDDCFNLLNLLLLRRREQIRTRNDFKNQAIVDPEHSSFSVLYKNGSDEDFINILGLNREGFHILLGRFRRFYREKYKEGRGGRPQKVDSCQALGLLLQFYAPTSELKLIGQLHGVRKNTASRILARAENALFLTL